MIARTPTNRCLTCPTRPVCPIHGRTGLIAHASSQGNRRHHREEQDSPKKENRVSRGCLGERSRSSPGSPDRHDSHPDQAHAGRHQGDIGSPSLAHHEEGRHQVGAGLTRTGSRGSYVGHKDEAQKREVRQCRVRRETRPRVRGTEAWGAPGGSEPHESGADRERPATGAASGAETQRRVQSTTESCTSLPQQASATAQSLHHNIANSGPISNRSRLQHD